MRLDKIKLAGFKSFVEPTTVELPGSLTAVLGPNGCGKSNIIDAVRWVMGESNARHLRGDSATDVIFSGSNNRKPVGQASVELIFNNSDGAVGGEYAKYAEISIKRVISRDGQSNYYLNNTKCRRKDITDIFLGTGIGPRSYSIIEQGMVSRFIEAKPDELRVFVEEAAGISKYRERRRETENRIRHTRENLERLTDLREELDRQLKKLEQQAQDAQKYQTLRDEQKVLQGELYALKWTNLHNKVANYDTVINEIVAKLEAANAKVDSISATIEKEQVILTEFNDKLNEAQESYYAKSSQIAKIEQEISHQKDKKNQLEKNLSEGEESLKECLSQQHADNEKLGYLENLIAEITPDYDSLQEVADVTSNKLLEAEQSMDEWQKKYAQIGDNLSGPAKQLESAKAHISNIERQLSNLSGRKEKLEEELGGFDHADLEEAISKLSTSIDEREAELKSIELELSDSAQKLAQQKSQVEAVNQSIKEKQNNLNEMQKRHAALTALQEAAYGMQNNEVVKWLEDNSLSDKKRLVETIKVQEGWETAVELVLSNSAEAICVDNLDDYYSIVDTLSTGNVVLVSKKLDVPSFEKQEESGGLFNKIASAYSGEKPQPLLSRIIEPNSEAVSFLGNVYSVANLKQAIALLPELKDFESVVTKDGFLLGPGWIRVNRGNSSEKDGIVVREQELSNLNSKINELELSLNALLEEQVELKNSTSKLDEQKEQQQALVNKAKITLSESLATLNIQQSELQQSIARQEQLSIELKESTANFENLSNELESEKQKQDSSSKLVEEYTIEKEQLLNEKQPLQESLYELRERAKIEKDNAHKVQLKLQAAYTEQQAITHGLGRFSKQIESWEERVKELKENIEVLLEPIKDSESALEVELEEHIVREHKLNQVRSDSTLQQEKIQSLELSRKESTVETEEVRTSLEEAKLNWQAEAVRLQGIEEQIETSGLVRDEIIKSIPDEADEKVWDKKLTKVERQIKALGPINLAAISEFGSQAERKNYLDEQDKDLTESMNLLEEAINKIDKETKTKFKETYDKLNDKFKELFPRLFGGGQAYLELIGDDLLDAGVAVIAKPPGKKNSLLSQLSGGEKALTAISLVFSIFHLNPAPFCLLDEVDAPLDDTNVGRFCDLLKEMTEKVQFIYISHNKIAMEMAQHLHGVTMKEPGVSRLVSVDMEEAVALAE